MAKRKRPKKTTISDQLRDFMNNDPRSRYRLCKLTGVDAGQLSRFARGKGRLGQDAADAIAAVLRLRIVQDDE